jgi:hypothetical protein
MVEVVVSKEKTFYHGTALQGKREVFLDALAPKLFSALDGSDCSFNHLSESNTLVCFRWNYFPEISYSVYCFECVLQQIENFERYPLVIPFVREASFFSTFGPLPA